jgi:hypothetical protein
MKFLCVAAALFFTLILAAGCVAEVMGSPSPSLPFMMKVDRALAVGCFAACCVALVRLREATVAIWLLIAAHASLCWKFDPPGQLSRGVLKFAIAAALFLTIGWVTERKRLLFVEGVDERADGQTDRRE